LLLRRSCAYQIADDHQPGGDPDARLELDGFDIEATNSVDGTQPCLRVPVESDHGFGWKMITQSGGT
jgi:hypothetical protein